MAKLVNLSIYDAVEILTAINIIKRKFLFRCFWQMRNENSRKDMIQYQYGIPIPSKIQY